ncbi:hypothetical protein Lsan_2637 [Legionella santicrucis]|uniref:N-acetyltransferase domain-containing protein n=1 Tax=Legionella santicrucis TaxID=45074 RepID=A0A0W0YJL5_9GAMM|nr:hypothetical protein [Legionella santicrucis]KTD57015.1 hypothetical protein Lsan_2637 [Legionella santicrucis]
MISEINIEEEKLQGSVELVEQCELNTRQRLYEIFIKYYSKTDRETFDKDLNEKQWVLLMKDHDGKIQGFTTMMLYDLVFQGKPIRAVFSGNTIIEKDFWGSGVLSKTWCHFMAYLKLSESDVPLYWYLISSGYRTYLFLPFFYKEFYPRYDKTTPPFEAQLIDTLGHIKFPDEYSNGLVRPLVPRECLQESIAQPPERKLKNPHVAFFLEKNPRYLLGDELVCLTEFSFENNLGAAHSALQKVNQTYFSKNQCDVSNA